MKIKTMLSLPLLLLTSTLAYGVPVLLSGTTPADDSTLPVTPVSPRFGTLINFDGLAQCGTFPPDGSCTNLSGNTFSGVTFTSADGLYAIPFSAQSAPNELFDNGTLGSANILITTAGGVMQIGVGIADSDILPSTLPVTITLQPLNALHTALGSAFNITIPETGGNPGNGYFVFQDTTADIFGLQITQSVPNANFSGLAIDDVQVTPEPSTFLLLSAGVAVFGFLRLRKRA